MTTLAQKAFDLFSNARRTTAVTTAARKVDPYVRKCIEYHFSDGSILQAHGAGRYHKLEVLDKKSGRPD